MRDDDDKPLDEREAAALLKINHETLGRMRRAGTGPRHFMIGSRYRYVRSAVLEWRAAQMRGVQAEG